MPSKDIKKALELINNKAYEEAIAFLQNLKNKKETSKIDYLLGYIHHITLYGSSFSNKKDTFQGSREEAKDYLGKAVNTKKPIEDAFLRLVDIEDNKTQALRIIRKGLKHFPNSADLYELLINRSEDILQIYQEIEAKRIGTNGIYLSCYNFYFKQGNYAKALAMINKVKAKKEEKQLLDLIKGFCFYELGSIKKASSVFSKLLNDDISQNLNYGQYVGMLLCFFKSKQTDEIIKLIKELPYEFPELYVYTGEFRGFGFSFEKYLNTAILQMLDFLKTKKEYKGSYIKIKGIKELYSLESSKVTKKTILSLKSIRNSVPEKEVFDKAMVQAYQYSGDLLNAFKQDLENAILYSHYDSEAEYILTEASKEDREDMIAIFINKVTVLSAWERTKLKEVFESVVDVLNKDKAIKKILKICEYFEEDFLEKTNVLFEIAYAHHDFDKPKAKKIYEKMWNKEQNNYSVANNLAILYEEEGDLERAKNLLEKAIELAPERDAAKDNLQRVNELIANQIKIKQRLTKEQEMVLKAIGRENIYIHEKLLYLIREEDSDQYIVASYGQLVDILETSLEKVQELIRSFLLKKYIIKIQEHQFDTMSNVYQVNSIVRGYLLQRELRIESNRPLTTIGENINLDSFESLGFDSRLLSCVDLKISDEKLKDILKRDLKENVFAILTESYKTALVLSGSIIESFILNKVLESGIRNYAPNPSTRKNKKVLNMDLSELLYVAEKNAIINVQLYHFSQALRQYRNLIHPAVEIRKNNITEVTERDAKLAWEITMQVIYKI